MKSLLQQNIVQQTVVTLAHELGHYLDYIMSLPNQDNGTCEDTDYCKDTKSYNKQEYDSNCDYIYENEREKYTFKNLVKTNRM